MKTHFFSKIDSGTFTKKDIQLTSTGLRLAEKSIDPAHGVAHIETLRDSYIAFKQENSPNVTTDDRVMAHAFVFHDSYKMQSVRSQNTLGIVLEEAFEGLSSANIFMKHAIQGGLEKGLIQKVIYAIRKHSTFNLLPRITNEAKLLFDLDDLDSINIDRFRKTFNNLKFSIDTQIRVALAYLSFRSKSGYYFEWSRAIFEKRKNKFLGELHKLKTELSGP